MSSHPERHIAAWKPLLRRREIINKIRRFLTFVSAIFLLAVLGGVLRYTLIETTEVTFRSGNLKLSGTLLLPPFATSSSGRSGVVLVHGSGAATRRSMMLYARIFAFAGHAALVYDKRGVGLSEGPADAWNYFSFNELADDASAAMSILRSNDAVDATRVGYFATSQGAWVASLATKRGPPPAFLVMVSASVSTIAEDRLYGMEARLRHAGFDESSIAKGVDLLQADHDVSRSGEGYVALAEAFRRHHDQAWFKEGFATELPATTHNLKRIWEKQTLDFDPRPLLESFDQPVLWVFGDPTLDRFAPVAMGQSWVATQQQRGKDHSVLVVEGADHNLNRTDAGPIENLLFVRLPLIARILAWLS